MSATVVSHAIEIEPDQRSAVYVLDADPDLGALLPAERMASARRALVARLYRAGVGHWQDERMHRGGPEQLGLLVLDGVIARELLLSDNVTTELLGAGDLLRPWQDQGPSTLLRAQVRWTVLEPVSGAVLDQAFARRVAPFPEVHAMLLDRAIERAHRLAFAQAISQLNGVEHRVLALFWHLAERWGRVTPDGTAIPINLPHRVIAQLIGARRPTVSTALSQLARTGAIHRRPEGGWLLLGEPVGSPAAHIRRPIRQRRRAAAETGARAL
jgi:CRP/FNR family transcriptional regulator, cyclic AMP receptor protein